MALSLQRAALRRGLLALDEAFEGIMLLESGRFTLARLNLLGPARVHGIQPQSHDVEALAKQLWAVHAAMQDALPCTEAKDKHHLGLLQRAYIKARYSRACA